MERIGTLLRRLKLDPDNLRDAAARNRAAQIQGDGLVEPSGNTSPSRLSSGEESGAASFGDRKPDAETPGVGRLGGRVRLKLVSINRGPGASANPHAAYGLPRPASGLRLVLVEGGRHASTG